MVRISIDYTGEKHCDLIHQPSGNKISTDAPKDNNGRGEAFSPTDLVAAALGSCILTTMAIKGEKENIDVRGCTATVDKEMNPEPRKIARLTVAVRLPKKLAALERKKLEEIAHNCPVAKSLHPEMQLPITFTYDL